MKLNTDLWMANARALRADRIARSNARHRKLFPWLFLAFVALAYLVHWINTL